eukprot:CAMPEP_0195005394 /NCGR_PEP_ID=MMETSP0326_2-20130528/5631_1 /TAXON_ID=2866 ORGANISM="Crypthecodinium cohnii, Strain Seligo" /NCGR_SAMPLE_ID=MMETSP0326_2 /ASSEMBLY_ACC=CAM_ASM_000348 /LENGTH=68 /DNA_ID=CAMNT_0040011443 /DNA_START=158 /DNA_END=361 /DNA_ORIENTATION=-
MDAEGTSKRVKIALCEKGPSLSKEVVLLLGAGLSKSPWPNTKTQKQQVHKTSCLESGGRHDEEIYAAH